MKYYALAFAAVLGTYALAVVPSIASAATPAYTDALCPGAVPDVTAFNNDALAKDYAKLVTDAQATANAYHICTVDARASTGLPVEPTVNYDQTREAQFLVVLGKLQVATGKSADAVASFKTALALATDVAQWMPDAESWTASNGLGGNSSSRNTDRQPSQYKEAAVAIQAAANAELAKLGLGPSPAPNAKP
jgi:hypothetical protein